MDDDKRTIETLEFGAMGLGLVLLERLKFDRSFARSSRLFKVYKYPATIKPNETQAHSFRFPHNVDPHCDLLVESRRIC